MKYLLSQEEYDSLVPKRQLDESKKALEIARELILAHFKDREYLPCVNDGETRYCSQCPISDIGGEPFEVRPAHKESSLICTEHRDYPK